MYKKFPDLGNVFRKLPNCEGELRYCNGKITKQKKLSRNIFYKKEKIGLFFDEGNLI